MDLSTQRIIETCPTAYNSGATPYSSVIFNGDIRDYCEQNANQSYNDPFSKCAKVILVGDMAVGKTSLLNRFTYDTFGLDHKATIGVDFAIIKFKILQLPFQLQVRLRGEIDPLVMIVGTESTIWSIGSYHQLIGDVDLQNL